MKEENIYSDLIGKQVLVRGYEAGVYFGTLQKVDGTTVKLTNVRNIWTWQGATCLSQVAEEGIKGGHVSQTVSSMVILNVCQIIPLSEAAADNLNKQPEWKA